MNTLVFILQQTLFFAVPLLIVALGAMYSEKSGVTNIAMEGIMTAGAFFGILVIHRLQGNISGQLLFVLAMLAGAESSGEPI